ncbi:MAG TPA: hypothetical protein VMI73_07050 [Trebonia sp.]|nr:hypothetical protein [Trebonia sp.]
MDENSNYIIVWAERDDAIGYRHCTLVYHDLPESDPRYSEWGFSPVRTYAKEDLKPTDRIVTDALEAKLLIERTSATSEEKMAIPVSLARELNWFPEAQYVEAA